MGRTHRFEFSAAPGTAEALPGAPALEAQGPRATRPRKSAQSHTREVPGETLSWNGGSGSGRAQYQELFKAEPGPVARRGLGTAGRAVSAAPRLSDVPFVPRTLPAPERQEVVRTVTHLRTGSREPGTAAQTGKVPAAAADQLPNSRSCACGAAIAQPPSLPSFKPPANGGATPRESAGSRLPRGQQDDRAGTARASRTGTRQPLSTYSPVISRTAALKFYFLSLNMLNSQVRRQISK